MLEFELYYNDEDSKNRVPHSHTLRIREVDDGGSHICFMGVTLKELDTYIKEYYPTNTANKIQELCKKYINEYDSINGEAKQFVRLRDYTEEDEPIISEADFISKINELLNSQALDFILN